MTQEAHPEVGAQQDAEPTFRGAVAVFSPIEAVLTDVRQKYSNVVYDLTTTKGDKEARQARAELVKVRTSADKAYKDWNQPILEQQRIARDKVAYIKGEVDKLEKPIDDQIKADEDRREAERKAKAEAEVVRIKTIRDRINVIAGLPLAVISMGSEQISAVISDLSSMPLNEERFAEFLDEAVRLTEEMKIKLAEVRDAALAREQEAARIERERQELEQARARQEAEAALERERLAREAQALEDARQQQEEEANRQRIIAEESQRQAAVNAAKDAQDAAAAIRAQQDAFAEERKAAERVLREEQDRIRELRAELARERAEQAAATQSAVIVAAPELPVEAAEIVEPAESADVAPVEREEVVAAQAVERPTDIGILRTVAHAYSVTEEVALGWLYGIKLDKLSESIKYTSIPF